LLQWLIFSAFYAAFVPLMPVLVSAAVTFAVFPLVALSLSWINKVLADRARPV
jgi:predicted RND superfamily exporter protein